MNSKAKKLLGLILGAVITTAPQAFADTDLTTEMLSDIQPSISVTARTVQNNLTIDGTSGRHSGLMGEFDLATNANSNFIMTAVAETNEGTVDAFGNDGNVLVFTNIDNKPDSSAVNCARGVTSGSSPNAIAYPFTLSVNEPMTLQWQPTNSQNKPRWAIFANNGTSATLKQTISGDPYNNSYERGIDAQGQYQATVIVTVMEQ